MGTVYKFQAAKNLDEHMIKEGESILSMMRRGRVKSAAYLIELDDGSTQYGIAGEYLLAPEKAFAPAAKAMFGLSTYIHDLGKKV